jgi:hypothetical protein
MAETIKAKVKVPVDFSSVGDPRVRLGQGFLEPMGICQGDMPHVLITTATNGKKKISCKTCGRSINTEVLIELI